MIDFDTYAYNIDRIVKMKTQVVEWKNLKNVSLLRLLFDHPKQQALAHPATNCQSIMNYWTYMETILCHEVSISKQETLVTWWRHHVNKVLAERSKRSESLKSIAFE